MATVVTVGRANDGRDVMTEAMLIYLSAGAGIAVTKSNARDLVMHRELANQ